jgi:hypothetical protein
MARWDGSSWCALGSGTDSVVYALTVHDDGSESGPLLHVGGHFSSVGCEQAHFTATWGRCCLSDAPVCADLDLDGVVGICDFLALLEAWGSCPQRVACPGDVDGDGTVGVIDFLLMLGNWG